jgi:hypothetical protein
LSLGTTPTSTSRSWRTLTDGQGFTAVACQTAPGSTAGSAGSGSHLAHRSPARRTDDRTQHTAHHQLQICGDEGGTGELHPAHPRPGRTRR